ncbi:hypothetical protein [Wenxinia marina]|uniref:hypothetical protein n=1 Tax=Wenxinia marina TaxID=390641 RepID=UPI0003A4863A|nr:hypothetical protein [Wenxinia marina]GGL74476.1 hypothetical protein GCM10011392_31380 [Wenxinia marina]
MIRPRFAVALRRPSLAPRTIRRLSFACLVLLCLALPLVIAGRIHEVRTQRLSTELNLAVLGLERSIGYGGLIHLFKNAVLRGAEEPAYLSGAEEAAARALAYMDKIELIQRDLGLGVGLSNQRQAITAYAEAVATIRAMHAAGRPIAEIDAAVRYDDVPALRDVWALHARIAEVLNDRLDALRPVVSILSHLALVSLFFLVVGGQLYRLTRSATTWRRSPASPRTTCGGRSCRCRISRASSSRTCPRRRPTWPRRGASRTAFPAPPRGSTGW